MRARTPTMFSRGQGTYTQGQSPEPRIREYFYYLDHQGQVFSLYGAFSLPLDRIWSNKYSQL